MKALKVIDADQTFFVFAQVAPAHEKVLEKLQYPRIKEGYGRAFPTNTPHLDHYFYNFERFAAEMLLQSAKEHPVPWEQALEAFLQIVRGQGIDWWLTGSAALSVRGMDIEPRDFDLVADDAGAQRLGELLFEYVYEPVVPVTDWICNWFGRAFLHARFEWIGGVNASTEDYGPSDVGPTAASQLETILWRGEKVRVPPLELQLRVNEQRGLDERVAMIEKYMRDAGKS